MTGEAIQTVEPAIVPGMSMRDLEDSRFDDVVVADFAWDILQQISDAYDGNIGNLPTNQHHGYQQILDAIREFCVSKPVEPGEQADPTFPTQAFVIIEHSLRFNLRGIMDPEWLESNPATYDAKDMVAV